jgi:hypothetical protein
LRSRPFAVRPSRALSIHPLGGGRFTLDHPPIDAMADLTTRPAHANGGTVRGVRHAHGTIFTLPAGTTIPAGAARDRYGNMNGTPATLK